MDSLGRLFDESWTATTKIAFVVCLFLLTLMFALLPMIVIKSYHTERDPTKQTRYARLIGLLNCFAGGVFFGTALLHLLPNVMNLLNQFGMEAKFPIAEFAVSFGFLVVLVTEQMGLACKEQEVDTLNPIQRLSQRTLPIVGSEIRSLRADEMQGSEEPVSLQLPKSVEPPPTSHLRSVLLLAVLSIHAVFDGLAIGVQTTMGSALNIFIAVILHKVIVAFSMGLKLLQSQLHLASVLALDLMFAIMSPIGLCLGFYLNMCDSGPRQQLFSGLLQGIACGSFLYITCFEVLPQQLSNGRDRLLKLLALLIGFSSSVGIIFINSS